MREGFELGLLDNQPLIIHNQLATKSYLLLYRSMYALTRLPLKKPQYQTKHLNDHQ
jgi:hypothetical protein